jgi:hypothetical protein
MRVQGERRKEVEGNLPALRKRPTNTIMRAPSMTACMSSRLTRSPRPRLPGFNFPPDLIKGGPGRASFPVISRQFRRDFAPPVRAGRPSRSTHLGDRAAAHASRDLELQLPGAP